jgi:hypothetical protein
MTLSKLPDTIYFPSGVIANDVIGLSCPVKVRISLPVFISHSFIVLSQLPEIIYFPSDDIATMV